MEYRYILNFYALQRSNLEFVQNLVFPRILGVSPYFSAFPQILGVSILGVSFHSFLGVRTYLPNISSCLFFRYPILSMADDDSSTTIGSEYNTACAYHLDYQ